MNVCKTRYLEGILEDNIDRFSHLLNDMHHVSKDIPIIFVKENVIITFTCNNILSSGY